MAARKTAQGAGPTRGDYANLQKQVEMLRGQLAEERRAHRQTRTDLQRATAQRDNTEVLRAAAEQRAEAAEARARRIPAQQPANPGEFREPSADEERYMFEADADGTPYLFANLAAAEEAQAERPDHWFDSPVAARARYAEIETTPLPAAPEAA